jgi:hypothetical protein
MSEKDKTHLIKLGNIETVAGVCPHCEEDAILVAIVTDYFRCTNCGEDTRQYINGSIKYLKLDDYDIEMAKKKSYIGSITFIKEFPRKRPDRHAKSFNKRLPKRKKARGQG